MKGVIGSRPSVQLFGTEDEPLTRPAGAVGNPVRAKAGIAWQYLPVKLGFASDVTCWRLAQWRPWDGGYRGCSPAGAPGEVGVLLAVCQVASSVAGSWSGGLPLATKAAAPAWRAACWVSSLSNTE
jgi:hypothetical protein